MDQGVRNAFRFSDGLRGDTFLLLIGMFGCCTISVLYPALLTYRADYKLSYEREHKRMMGGAGGGGGSKLDGSKLQSSAGEGLGYPKFPSTNRATPPPPPPIKVGGDATTTPILPSRAGLTTAHTSKQRTGSVGNDSPLRRASAPSDGTNTAFAFTPTATATASASVVALPGITLEQVLGCPQALLLFRQFCIEHFGECTPFLPFSHWFVCVFLCVADMNLWCAVLCVD